VRLSSCVPSTPLFILGQQKHVNKNLAYLTQDETKGLFSPIKNKRDRAIFLTTYRHEQQPG
jgi:hypothetical protein